MVETSFYPGCRKCTNEAETGGANCSSERKKIVPLRTIGLIIAAMFCLAATGGEGPRQADKYSASYRHGYYLFLAGAPQGCEDCYVPLLLTRKSIANLKENPTPEDCVLITTFERDSIWNYDGLARIGQSEINTAERKVRISDKTYRYQEIGASEVLRLLQNPLGKIPISRPYLPAKLPAGPELKQLVSDFKTTK